MIATYVDNQQRVVPNFTDTSVVTGTHGYMAPEYFESIVSPGLDCYAFGVVST